MNLATLRVEGDEAALTAMLSSLALEPDTSWKKGQTRRAGTYSSSGFNVTVADAATPKQLLVAVRSFLAECREFRDILRAPSLSVELDVGFTVGDSEQFAASLRFDPSDLPFGVKRDLESAEKYLRLAIEHQYPYAYLVLARVAFPAAASLSESPAEQSPGA